MEIVRVLVWLCACLAPAVRPAQAAAAAACPAQCTCRVPMVMCRDRNFTAIPGDLPADTRDLFLHGHRLGVLRAGALASVTGLASLIFTECGLHTVEAGAFAGLERLTAIDLSSNRIARLPPALFAGLTALRSVQLNDNRLTELVAGSFAGLTLTTLSLENNPALGRMAAATFTGARVAQLSFYMCNLRDDSLAALRPLNDSLTELSLDSNRRPLTIPHDLFADFTFSHLSLKRDGLADVAFLEHVHADDVSLDGNPLGTVDFGRYAGLANTRRLSLANTSLQALNSTGFGGMTQLKQLYLQDNRIRSFSIDWLGVFYRLDRLAIERNPLHCNCEVEWLRTWLQSSAVAGVVTCRTPAIRPLKDLPADALVCRAPSPVLLSRTPTDDGPATVQCSSDGDPAPDMTWVAPNGSELMRVPADRSSNLTTTEIRVDAQTAASGGVYRCVAHNVAGKSSVGVDITPYRMTATDSAAKTGAESCVLLVISMLACANWNKLL